MQPTATNPCPRYRVGLRLADWMEGFGIRLFSGILDFLRESGCEWEICYDKSSGGDLHPAAIGPQWEGDGLIVFRHSAKEAAAWRARGINYRQGSHLWLLLQQMVTEIADRILRRRIEERDNATVAAPTF